MSVRVVARIRPLLDQERDRDVIVRAESAEAGRPSTVVKIPNPKNESEEFSFAFNSVYDHATSQETLFTSEGTPALLLFPSPSSPIRRTRGSRPRLVALCRWLTREGEQLHHS